MHQHTSTRPRIDTDIPSILKKWREETIPLWPVDHRRDDRRLSLILRQAISTQEAVQLFAAVCPDYPERSLTGELGTGITDSMVSTIEALQGISILLSTHNIPHQGTILLADTEIDLPDVVTLLAGDAETFLARCQQSVDRIRSQLHIDTLQAHTFTEFFGGQWHVMQAYWETVIRQQMQSDSALGISLRYIAADRRDKYSKHLGRQCNAEECLAMAIRHYAQYETLGRWMRQFRGAIMINPDSPNLRAIRKPSNLDGPACSPVVADPHLRIPVIVL